MASVLGIALLALTLSRPTVAFVPIGGGGSTHVSITGMALLQKVTDTCRKVVEEMGHEFKPTVGWKMKKKKSHTTHLGLIATQTS